MEFFGKVDDRSGVLLFLLNQRQRRSCLPSYHHITDRRGHRLARLAHPALEIIRDGLDRLRVSIARRILTHSVGNGVADEAQAAIELLVHLVHDTRHARLDGLELADKGGVDFSSAVFLLAAPVLVSATTTSD